MYKINFKLEDCKDFSGLKEFIEKNKIKLIIFGETHGMINESTVQKEILKNISASFFLYELLEEEKILNNEDAQIFLEKPDNQSFSIISTFRELKPTVKLARTFNLPLIGCDIKNMLRKDKSFLKKTNLTKEEMKDEEEIMKKREIQQKKVIKEYLLNSDKLIFVSLGLYHLRENSFLIKNLDENFLIIYPIVNGKKKLWEVEDFNPDEISYIITSKEKYFKN